MAAEGAAAPSSGAGRRVGLYGGSFDPVHEAHVALARLALEELRLDELRAVPAGHPWQKGGTHATGAERADMLRLAFAGEPRVVVDESELEREGASYTVDTVREWQAREPGLQVFLVIGQDQYDRIHTWREWQDLLQRVTLAVAGRGGAEATPAALRSTPHRVHRLPLPRMDLSSTEIRARAARGLPLDGMVPPGVAGYIDRHAVYRTAPPRS